jgi:phenylalanyl-tRNA synthetase alpha subunit
MVDLTQKAETLADKMNKITEKFSDNLDTADEMVLTGDDVLNSVEQKTQNPELYKESSTTTEIINLDNMVSDFRYVRETLRENTDNGRRILNIITLDLLAEDADKDRIELINSFAELNKAIAENMKLYIVAYKEISKTLLNIDNLKVDKTPKDITPETGQTVSTVDLIKQLAEKD